MSNAYSPTGYWAHLSVRMKGKGAAGPGEPLDIHPRPVLHWNDDGQPIVADEGGDLTTVPAWLDQWIGDCDEEYTYTGAFEVQPWGDEG